jgi:hypothetical protein
VLGHQVQHCFEPSDDNRDGQIDVSGIGELTTTSRNVSQLIRRALDLSPKLVAKLVNRGAHLPHPNAKSEQASGSIARAFANDAPPALLPDAVCS